MIPNLLDVVRALVVALFSTLACVAALASLASAADGLSARANIHLDPNDNLVLQPLANAAVIVNGSLFISGAQSNLNFNRTALNLAVDLVVKQLFPCLGNYSSCPSGTSCTSGFKCV